MHGVSERLEQAPEQTGAARARERGDPRPKRQRLLGQLGTRAADLPASAVV
jgi:hypothetical protein